MGDVMHKRVTALEALASLLMSRTLTRQAGNRAIEAGKQLEQQEFMNLLNKYLDFPEVEGRGWEERGKLDRPPYDWVHRESGFSSMFTNVHGEEWFACYESGALLITSCDVDWVVFAYTGELSKITSALSMDDEELLWLAACVASSSYYQA